MFLLNGCVTLEDKDCQNGQSECDNFGFHEYVDCECACGLGWTGVVGDCEFVPGLNAIGYKLSIYQDLDNDGIYETSVRTNRDAKVTTSDANTKLSIYERDRFENSVPLIPIMINVEFNPNVNSSQIEHQFAQIENGSIGLYIYGDITSNPTNMQIDIWGYSEDSEVEGSYYYKLERGY